MKNCDACGKQLKGGIGIGGAMLCRTCSEDVRNEIDRLRAEGKQVNALGIARKIYRETHSAGNYYLRDVPKDLMDQIKEQAHQQGLSIRDWMLQSFRSSL